MFSVINKTKSEYFKNLLFGLLVLALMTYLSYGMAAGLQNRLSQNPLLIAVLFGIFIGNIFVIPEKMTPSIDFTIAYLVKAGVVLVGLKISAQVIVSMGNGPVLVAIGELISVFVFTYFFMNKVMKYDGKFAVLVAAGSAICGAAAILAIAMVVNGKQRLVTLSVTIITLMGTLQLFIYPYLYNWGYLDSFNDQLFGVFAGAGIYEIAQVYGASYAVSDTAIHYSTLVKLIKVMMLVPMIFIISHLYNKKEMDSVNKAKLPWFIVLFVLMVVLNSTFTINGTVKIIIGQLGAFLFLMAMVALGLKTNLRNIMLEHDVKKLIVASSVIIIFTTVVSYYYTLWSAADTKASNDTGLGVAVVNHKFDGNYYGGKEVFRTIGCSKCHVESLPTKSGEELLLYSDLLIHDMGPALDDKITQGLAIGTDWRTTPLVGIGGRTRFLHDGRALTYRDAIIAHDGEAKIVRDRFIDLNKEEKEDIYKFLASLK